MDGCVAGVEASGLKPGSDAQAEGVGRKVGGEPNFTAERLCAVRCPNAFKSRANPPQAKADPAIVAKARELRDCWLEQVNANGLLSIAGKYDVARIAA